MVDNRDLEELPPAVAEEIAAARGRLMQKLDAFALYVSEKRDEAVKARKASGIEEIWTYCEEAYLGIDDLNRHEWAGQKWAQWIKSPSMEGPLRRSRVDEEMRATAYPRLTARYVDAGAAKMAEILLPVDGKPFSLKATPVPQLSRALKNKTQVIDPATGRPATRPPRPDEMPPVQQPQGPAPMQGGPGTAAQPPQEPSAPQVPLTVKDLAEHQIALAEEAAEEATDQIHDWLVECRHGPTMRKTIFDGSRLGTMIVKGPIPARREARMVRTGDGGVTVEVVSKVVPESARVSPWNFFPDPSCGEDIQRGAYVVELDEINEKGLRALRDQKGYIPWAIDRVIDEGPDKCNTRNEGRTATQQAHSGVYKLWTFWGSISADQLKISNPELYQQHRDKIGRQVYAIVTMVNDTPIKVALNPLKTGRFPHKVAVWRRRDGHWAGMGVAEQMKAPQQIMTGAVRGLLNNAGKSSGAQIVRNDEALIPANGSNTITPDKEWIKDPGASLEDVRNAFAVFTIPNVTPQMLSIIEFAFRLAEESTSIPLITQGQSGDTTPDTFGATQLQNNNANQLLRDVGFSIAEDLTEPLIGDFYEWLLLDPNVPDSAKGDFQADVSGMTALIEKAVQDQTIAMMGGMVANPAFGIDPKRWFRQFLRSKRLVPTDFQYSEAEQREIDSRPPPPPPQVQAAQIRAEAQVATAQSRDQLAAQKIKVDTDRDALAIQAQAQRTQMERETNLAELAIKRELAMLDYANRYQISLDSVKADLAKTTMQLKAQMVLSGDDGKGPEVAKPAVEPEGRAPDDQAFQR